VNKPSHSAINLMPNSIEAIEILRHRAEKLAYSSSDEIQDKASQIYLQFQLNEQKKYGINQSMLDAVIDSNGLTSLNWLPAFIAGVIAWQGHILTILDTNFLCSESPITDVPKGKIIIVSHQGKKLGLLVNEIEGFIEYGESQVVNSVQSPIKSNPAYFLGLIDNSIILLNTFELFADSALEIR